MFLGCFQEWPRPAWWRLDGRSLGRLYRLEFMLTIDIKFLLNECFPVFSAEGKLFTASLLYAYTKKGKSKQNRYGTHTDGGRQAGKQPQPCVKCGEETR